MKKMRIYSKTFQNFLDLFVNLKLKTGGFTFFNEINPRLRRISAIYDF